MTNALRNHATYVGEGKPLTRVTSGFCGFVRSLPPLQGGEGCRKPCKKPCRKPCKGPCSTEKREKGGRKWVREEQGSSALPSVQKERIAGSPLEAQLEQPPTWYTGKRQSSPGLGFSSLSSAVALRARETRPMGHTWPASASTATELLCKSWRWFPLAERAPPPSSRHLTRD